LNGVQALTGELGSRALPLAANLVDPAEAEHVAQFTLDHFGRIDILLNLAGGISGGQPVSNSPADELDKMPGINLRTTYNLSRVAVKPMMKQKWGRVVNVGSRDSLKGRAKFSAYAISKAAVLRLTESMAAEVKEYGITVNAVLPNTIDTETNRKNMPNADFSKWIEPEIIAETLLFLTSEDTAINGAAIPLYGQT
jgi:NAD(P)-dependent dehydrogenase (short-subunit alcohol dehydrogenase family)